MEFKMVSPQKHFLLILFTLLSASFSYAQITRTVGQSGGDYATLKAAFDAINNTTLTGDVSLEIIDNTTETSTPSLYGCDRVFAATITNGGSGYASAATTTVTFSAPPAGGITATGTVTVVSGSITKINISNPGFGYTSPPTITITSATGVNATATAIIPNYSSVKIYPTVAGKTISGSEIVLYGADNVTIDGQLNQNGKNVDLTIENLITTSNVATLRFFDEATHNRVKYVKLKSGSSTGSVIWFQWSYSASTLGNSDNTIEYCELTGIGTNRPSNVVYSSGSANAINQNNIIQHNKIYDHLSSDTASNGIHLNSYSERFVIANNSFYSTTANIISSTTNFIYIFSGAHTIRDNYIGGSEPFCGGNPTRFIVKPPTNTINIRMIYIYTGVVGVNSVQGNVVSNMELIGPSTFKAGLIVFDLSSSANVGTEKGNRIGSSTRVNDIVCTNIKTIQGINSGSANSVINIANNTIAGITLGCNANSVSGVDFNFTGIKMGYGTGTIENNSIGSETLPFSIYASNSALGMVQNVTGISCSSTNTGTKLIKNNIVANLVNGSENASTPGLTGNGYIHGIDLAASYAINVTVENNRVHDLSIANANSLSDSYSSVIGINSLASNSTADTGNSINGNLVYNLKNTNPSFSGVLYGLYYSGNSLVNNTMVSKNFIHSITADVTATNARIQGIYLKGRPSTVSNNIVNLGGNHSYGLFGIYDESNSLLYHNTLTINGNATTGSSSSYAIYSTSATISNYSNNLLINTRTNTSGSGKHYGMYVTAATPTVMNYNNYWVTGTGGVLGYKGADKNTLALWKTATGKEVNSLSIDPQLDSPGGTLAINYKPNTTSLVGISGTGITTDNLGVTRGSTPTIGALEYCLNSTTVTAISPTSGALGSTVQIVGANFSTATAVTFNGQSATFTINSPTLITATVPAGATTGKITVTNPCGDTLSPSDYTVTALVPTISSFSPAIATVGSTVTLTGTNFTGATTLTINGMEILNFVIDSATQIHFLVPNGASTGTISVSTPIGTGGTATSATSIQILNDFVVSTQKNGIANGSIRINAYGGLSPYTYTWSPSVGTSSTVSGLVPGTYTCVVTDSNTNSITKIMTLPSQAALSASISQTNNTVYGGSTGTASVSVSGGVFPYTYLWSPSGGTAATATGLSAGTFTCTITDGIGATIVKTFTITQPTQLTATTTQTNVSVAGGATGSATVTVSGGVTNLSTLYPYIYAWSPSGGTDATATGLAAGTFTCTITDANGATIVKTFTITEPTQLIASSSQTNNTVYGGTTGTATVTASGGASPYTYAWSPSGGTAATATALVAGSYSCTITDANGATVVKTVTITQPTLLTATSSQMNNTVYGGTTGTATVTASGGVSPYTYAWSPTGGTVATATALAEGNYSCTITDANGATLVKTFTITEPAQLTATSSQTNNTIYGGTTGTATVTASGGVSPYAYVWSPSGGTAATATGLAAGTFTCTITDANGATVVKTVTITQPTQLTATSSQTNNIIYGGTTGTATVTASGGVSPYTYAWSPSGGTAATATGLAAGTFTCTITDANGATVVKTVTITQPTQLTATSSQTNNIIYGGTTGTATVTASGGVSPYTYAWSPSGGTAATATALAAGTFTCTITDANGATLVKTFAITEPTQLTATSSQTNNTIYGGATGTATVTASGGVSPYAYTWSPSGGTASTATVLVAGSYSCTITDANGATVVKTVTITQPTLLTATTSQTNNTITGGAAGTATVTASGGVSPYTYAWSPLGGTAATATALVAGNYSCTITDANGATLVKTFIITQSASATQIPVLISPSSNSNVGATLPINYSLPEAPLSGSVRLIFTPTAGGTSIVWTMNNATSVNFAYSVGTNPILLSNVVSGTALAFTNYDITLSYQNSFAAPAAVVTNSNIQTLAPPTISLAQTNYNGIVGVAINPILIQNTGGAATFTITPALPNGLTLNTTTGGITGLPIAPMVSTLFTITSSNTAGISTISFRLFIDQDTDGDGLLNAVDPDDDGDGVVDGNDAFPLDKNEWTDSDHDGIGDNADTDDDNDGILDTCDVDTNGDGIPDNGIDLDGDGIIDSCDSDIDGDGVNNTIDNCPNVGNANQADRDHDGKGDACDTIELNTAQAITPNGDGINDTWVIYNLANHPHSTVRVFNANGIEVFYSSNYQNNWLGNYQGKSEMLPVGSYLYQIDLDSDGSIDEQGWLYITK
jgi:gliding motility-associated-like protein